MRLPFLMFVFAAGGLLAASCAKPSSSPFGSGAAGGSGGSSMGPCQPCLTDANCGSGRCGQFAGDTYCAPLCNAGACPAGRKCQTLTTAEGQQVDLCIPVTNVCAGQGTGGSGGTGASGGTGGGQATGGTGGTSGTGGGNSTGGTGGTPGTCGALDGPSISSCCHSCSSGSSNCQANGCYGGWYCNSQTCRCESPPNPATCGGTGGSGGSGGSGGTGGGGIGGATGTVGPNGGTLSRLGFAVVGDTRPATEDDTAGYPTGVITKIWQDVQAENPRPPFALTTGDYMFANPNGNQGAAQLNTYLSARANYTDIVFPTMGNHECTGATASNCGSGSTDGITNNYTAFVQKLLSPIGKSNPYYEIDVNASNGAWTSKFLFVAANAWSSTQASWLNTAMSRATTYTFVVRHEGSYATTAPGVSPSATIMANHPYTMLIAGHTHSFRYYSSEKQIINGNGGAPLTSSANYGYLTAWQRNDGSILFTEKDYSTRAVVQTFAVKADGTPTP